MTPQYILDDFALFGGLHCETSSVWKVLQYHDLEISEEMLFGLAGGIGFIYWYMKQMPAPIVGGRGGGRYFIENMGSRFGGQITPRRTQSKKRGHHWLLEKLAAGEPTILYADMAYLPYTGVPEDAHFGQHVFVVYGVDESKNLVYISDRGQSGVTVTIEELQRARASKFPPWPPQHAIFDFEYPPKIQITAKDIRSALRQCVTGMLDTPISNFGLRGFDKWAKLVLKWPKLFPGGRLYDVLYQGFIYIETGGTGGSAFRPMFARFLQEAQAIPGVPKMDAVIAKYEEAAQLWSQIAREYLPDEYPVLAKCREILWEQSRIGEASPVNAGQQIQKLNQQLAQMEPVILDALKEAPKFLPTIHDTILQLATVEKDAIYLLKTTLT